MSQGVIPQLVAVWRKSVLLTVGAISLGAEKLESSLGGILRTADRPDRGARVKVPVRAGKVETRRVGRAVTAPEAVTASKPVERTHPSRARAASGKRMHRHDAKTRDAKTRDAVKRVTVKSVPVAARQNAPRKSGVQKVRVRAAHVPEAHAADPAIVTPVETRVESQTNAN